MKGKILLIIMILILAATSIIYVYFKNNPANVSTISNDVVLMSPNWDLSLKAGTDCTNAKERNEDLQSIEITNTIKEAETHNYTCDLMIDGVKIDNNPKRSYQIISSDKNFSIYQDHLVLLCCSQEWSREQCNKRTLTKFCE